MPYQKKDVLMLASIVSVAILILASTACPVVHNNDDTENTYVVNTITTTNSVENKICIISDCLTESLETIDDTSCHSKIAISDVFTGDENDYWVDITFTEDDDQITTTCETNYTDMPDLSNSSPEFYVDENGDISDITFQYEGRTISFNDVYDDEEDCVFWFATVAEVALVVVVVIGVSKIIEDSNKKEPESTPEPTPEPSPVTPSPDPVTPVVDPDPVVPVVVPDPVVVTPEPTVDPEPTVEPDVDDNELSKYPTTEGQLGKQYAREAAEYYTENGKGFFGRIMYNIQLSLNTLKYSHADWIEITPGVSYCEYGDKLLAFSAMGLITTIVDLITYDNANKLDSLKGDVYYFALLYYDKVIIVPIEISESCAVCIMRMDQSKWKNPGDWLGLLNIWSKTPDFAEKAARKASNGLDPVYDPAHSYKKGKLYFGYYDHYHVHDRLTDAHAFFGKPLKLEGMISP